MALARCPQASVDGAGRPAGSQKWSWVERGGVQEAPAGRGRRDPWHKAGSHLTLSAGSCRAHVAAASGLGPRARRAELFAQDPAPSVRLRRAGGVTLGHSVPRLDRLLGFSVPGVRSLGAESNQGQSGCGTGVFPGSPGGHAWPSRCAREPHAWGLGAIQAHQRTFSGGIPG